MDKVLDQDISWYLRLRSATAAALCVCGTLGWGPILPTPLVVLFWVFGGLTIASNRLLSGQVEGIRRHRRLVFTVILDIVILTLVLGLSGGASNPFSFFYVVHVGIAALLLGESWTWVVALISSLGFGGLFFVHREVPLLSHHHASVNTSFSLHLQGMWVAFTLVAAVLALFFTRFVRSISEKNGELLRLMQKNMRAERYAISATLAASAAHEINTPLSSIRLLVESLQEQLANSAESERVSIILKELTRCQEIIRKLRTDSGGGVGELPDEELASEIIADSVKNFASEDRARIVIDQSCEDTTLYAPREGLVVSVRALLKNALEASSEQVFIAVERDETLQKIVVINPDVIISEDTVARIGEPFFTTKETSRNLGLGVYLARGMAESLGGGLVYRSNKDVGTTAEFSFSANYVTPKEAQHG